LAKAAKIVAPDADVVGVVVAGSGTHYLNSTAAAATSSDWVELKGSFTPTIVGTLTAAGVNVAGAPVSVDIYIDDVTITATKL
jgi:hypothetical protein